MKERLGKYGLGELFPLISSGNFVELTPHDEELLSTLDLSGTGKSLLRFNEPDRFPNGIPVEWLGYSSNDFGVEVPADTTLLFVPNSKGRGELYPASLDDARIIYDTI